MSAFLINVYNTHNADYIDALSAEKGDFLGGGSDVIFLEPVIDDAKGKVSIGITRKRPAGGVNGSGVVAKVTFQSESATPDGTSLGFTITDIDANDPSGIAIPFMPQPLDSDGNNITITVIPGDKPLPVLVSAFTVVPSDYGVALKWHTESEINNLGFDVYRGESPDGHFVKVNSAYIKGAGTDSTPHNYRFVDENAVVGKTYYYYIEAISFSGERERSHIIKVVIDASGKAKVTSLMQPTASALLQNFPNPFNPETWIPFRLAEDADVTIRIFDIKGEEVRRIHLGQIPAGYYDTKGKAVLWDGKDGYGQEVSSGVYFYAIRAGNFVAQKKMIIVR